ncbi:hypothetical protein VE04_08031 [Pseudogymnoascus sp. 24MN13]|nr:hypothetical protein VE04_08031 [Pseudogymnoascus sp. 24MN13]
MAKATEFLNHSIYGTDLWECYPRELRQYARRYIDTDVVKNLSKSHIAATSKKTIEGALEIANMLSSLLCPSRRSTFLTAVHFLVAIMPLPPRNDVVSQCCRQNSAVHFFLLPFLCAEYLHDSFHRQTTLNILLPTYMRCTKSREARIAWLRDGILGNGCHRGDSDYYRVARGSHSERIGGHGAAATEIGTADAERTAAGAARIAAETEAKAAAIERRCAQLQREAMKSKRTIIETKQKKTAEDREHMEKYWKSHAAAQQQILEQQQYTNILLLYHI